MTVWGFDVDSYNKAGFAFQTAKAQGYRCALIKFGGMNLPGNAPYMMNGYHAFVQAALDVGFDVVGDYIVTGGSNPAAAAQFWLRNRHGGLDFHELDNEKLDSGNPWNDGQACVYFDTIGNASDRWMYGSRDSLWNAGSWPGLASRKIKAHVAIYNGSPFQNIVPRTYPAELVLAHQFTSSASIGGLGAIDANAYADNAFVTFNSGRKNPMAVYLAMQTTGGVYRVWTEKPKIKYIPTTQELNMGLAADGYGTVFAPDYSKIIGLNDDDFTRVLWDFGWDPYGPNLLNDVKNLPAQQQAGGSSLLELPQATVSIDQATAQSIIDGLAAKITPGVTVEQVTTAVKTELDALVLKPVTA